MSYIFKYLKWNMELVFAEVSVCGGSLKFSVFTVWLARVFQVVCGFFFFYHLCLLHRSAPLHSLALLQCMNFLVLDFFRKILDTFFTEEVEEIIVPYSFLFFLWLC